MSEMGPKAALTAPKSDFRFTPESGLRSDIAPCPKSHTTRFTVQRTASLFDHLVGAGQQRRGHNETDCLRRLEVDDQFEFGRLLDRQIARL